MPHRNRPVVGSRPVSLLAIAASAVLSAFSAASAAPPTMDSPQPASWRSFIDEGRSERSRPEHRAVEFLVRHRPARDADIDPDLLRDNLRCAMTAREEFPWAGDVPQELFLNDVLPYAVLDETRENWRPAMLERCRPIVADCETAAEAAQALNRELFDLVNVHYNTGRKKPNQSPAESIEQGIATCTGLSILLVDACRSVGIPARVAGVASWHDKRGNHTWVEIHDGQRWRFTGADEYDKNGLDRGWFTGDASKARAGDPTYAVWASSFRPTGSSFPLVWNQGDTTVHGVDVTARYTGDRSAEPVSPGTVYVRVFATRGGDRIVAGVRTQGSPESDGVLTRAGTADLNDMPAIPADPDHPVTLVLTYGNEERVAHVPVRDAITRTATLYWEELGLTEDGAERAVGEAFSRRAEEIADQRRPEAEAEAFTVGDKTLKILEKTFGESAPEGGRSLWISMHGGGGAPPEVNDQQWRNQIRLYEPEEGIYIAPRAPTDTWNLWHQAHVDDLFDRLIETYIATRGVNPDKVYLMGYSAGGDGVFQLAPRMADRFAAAAMMAGHPNETRPDGLRNLPFAVLMGGDDAAYDRNKKAAEWREMLADLRGEDRGGYPHRVKIYEGMGHWMQRKDAEILPWMAEQTRNAWPEKIVWLQDDVTHGRFYWLALDPEQATARDRITASVDGQSITIDTPDSVTSIRLRLRDELIDLDRPITVTVNGAPLHAGVVPRTRAAIDRSLDERNDPRSAATAELELSWESQAEQTEAAAH